MYLIRYVGTQLKTAHHAASFAPIFQRAAEVGLRGCLVCSRPPADDRWLNPLHEIGVKIVYLPRPRRNFDLGCMWRAYRLCKQLSASVLHCDNMHTSPLLGAALARVPVRVWSKRSMQPAFEAGRRPTFRDRLALSVRVSCRLCTRVLAVSSAVRDELAELGVPRNRLAVLRNAVNLENLRVMPRAAARAKFGFAESDLVFTAIGRSVPVKGWDILLRAFTPIANDRSEARLLLVGDTANSPDHEYFELLARMMDERHLRDRVRFPGYLTDLSDVWGATDIFVMPSRSEGDSNALLQALATGQASVATRVGSAADLIRDGENGLLIARDDAKALSDAMRRLADDAALREQLRAANAGAHLAPTIHEHAEQLANIYAELLRERKRIGSDGAFPESTIAPEFASPAIELESIREG